MADNSFLQNLRMNSIFPAPRADGSQPNPSPLIGMPNFYSGRPVYYGSDTINANGTSANNSGNNTRNGLQQVAGQVANSDPEAAWKSIWHPHDNYGKPLAGGANSDGTMGVVYKAPRSDSFATDIIMGDSDADKKLALAKSVADQKNSQSAAGNAIKTAHEAMWEKIQGGKATDAEKQQWKIDEINTKGGLASDLQYGIQGMKADQQNYNQGVKGEQGMAQTNAKIAGSAANTNARIAAGKENTATRSNTQRDIANNRNNTPTQGIAATRDAMLKIQTTRPDLSQYLVKDPTTGVTSIDQNTPLAELSMIQNLISPQQKSDIQLPSSNQSSGTPTSKTPTVSDPMGLR